MLKWLKYWVSCNELTHDFKDTCQVFFNSIWTENVWKIRAKMYKIALAIVLMNLKNSSVRPFVSECLWFRTVGIYQLILTNAENGLNSKEFYFIYLSQKHSFVNKIIVSMQNSTPKSTNRLYAACAYQISRRFFLSRLFLHAKWSIKFWAKRAKKCAIHQSSLWNIWSSLKRMSKQISIKF